MEDMYQLLITALTTIVVVAANELAKTVRRKPSRRKPKS